MKRLKLFFCEHRQALAALCAVGLLYFLFDVVQIGCPILYVTGIPCMGCGMTRAFAALLRLDFAAAFAYHPLVFAMPFLAAALLLRKQISPKLWRALWVAVVAAFVIVYLLRLCSPGDPVVYVQWEQGLLGQALDCLTNLR